MCAQYNSVLYSRCATHAKTVILYTHDGRRRATAGFERKQNIESELRYRKCPSVCDLGETCFRVILRRTPAIYLSFRVRAHCRPNAYLYTRSKNEFPMFDQLSVEQRHCQMFKQRTLVRFRWKQYNIMLKLPK